MALTAPVPWDEALQYLQSRQVMPTDLGSDALKLVQSAIRERSLFSARTTNAGYLQEVKDGIDRMLSGQANEATVRMELQKILDGMGYDPKAGGFPGETPAPEAERHELRDLSSDKRVKLVLETNLRQVANFAYREQGLSAEAIFQYPAWELVRIYVRRVPRGSSGRDSDLGWQERWVRSGGKLYQGRMIAAKDDAVWENLGDSGVFSDGLDTPYPPFAFNSGYGIREVGRAECLALGVPLPTTRDRRGEVGLNDDLEVDAEQFDDEFLAVLEKDLREQAGALRVKNRVRGDAEARRIANRCLGVLDALSNGRQVAA